ncbi:hypothetical protein [Sulfitobacter sp. EE-36]|uniref:hypothetical protein n=1 Tax=Sulfitobacter TaxID=60136 RepID=UPI000066AF1E|nr:hypothetical protein [Sulfitobacter sp. EE-36]EAP83860.1 hypothetical protein EE36_12378 [Sulfitobacter sp. EE-36]
MKTTDLRGLRYSIQIIGAEHPRGTVAQSMCHRPQATRRDDNAVLRVARRRGCVYKGVD